MSELAVTFARVPHLGAFKIALLAFHGVLPRQNIFVDILVFELMLSVPFA